MRRFTFLLALVLTIPLTARQDSARAGEPSAPARDEDGKPALEETIVVTATRSERALGELPVSTVVVSAGEMKSAPAVWIDDVLRAIPGIQMNLQGSAITGPQSQTVSMHGLGGTRALVLLDGLPLHDPYYGTVQWQKVPMASLRQVEVVRGGNASLFGSSALGGTINLLTRPAEESAVRLDVSSATSDTQRRAVQVEHAIGRALAIRLTHDRYDSDGFMRVPNPGPADRLSTNATAVSVARIDYRPSDLTQAFLTASLADIRIGEGVNISASDRDFLDLAAGFRRVVGKGLVSATAFVQDQEEQRTDALIIGARDDSYISAVSVIPVSASGASLEWSTQGAGGIGLLSLGVDLQQVGATEYRDTWSRTGAYTGKVVVAGRQRSAGAFGQVSWHPTGRLEILASARLDSFRNSDATERGAGGETTTFPSASYLELDPRISFRWSAGSRTAVRGALYRAFKAPPLREIYRTTVTGSTTILANPSLEPETLVGGEIGIEWVHPRLRVEANLYRSDIDGFQVRARVPGQPPNVIQPTNLGKTRSQGVDAAASLELARRWSLNLGYTFADSTIVEHPDASIVGNELPEVPPHAGTFALRFRGDGGATFEARGRILSHMYGEPTNAVPAPAHRVFDFAASCPLRPWLDAYASIENAFDEQYYFVLTPAAFRSALPRIITAGVRVTLPAHRRRLGG